LLLLALSLIAGAGAADAPVEASADAPVEHVSGAPWSLRVPADEAIISLSGPDERVRVTLHAADQSARARLGWLPDHDPAVGQIAVELDALWLPPGEVWQVEVGGRRWPLAVASGAADPSQTVELPPDADGVLGLQAVGGRVSVAWSQAQDGAAEVPLGGAWDLTATGTDRPAVARTGGGTAQLASPIPAPRPLQDAGTLWVRAGLVPLTGLVVVVGAISLLGAIRRRGAWMLALAAVVAAFVVLGPSWSDLAHRLLATGGPVTDPTDSVAQLAALADALAQLSSRTGLFSAPEGASWLTAGPAWLGYLPVIPLVALWGPVAGHNVGVGLGVAALALCTGWLAQSRGVRPSLAAAAGLLAALTPIVLDEVDAWSLDRTTLWVAPLVMIALDRATRPGARGPVLIGVALLTAVLGQIYYGILLCVAAPALCLVRVALLRSADGAVGRLRRLSLGGAASVVLVVPVLLMLQAGTAGSDYAARADLSARLAAVTTPLSVDEAEQMAESGRRATGFRSFALGSARDRVLAAGSMSLSAQEVLVPRGWLVGGAAFWLLGLGSVALARRRRWAWLTLAEVGLLMSLALGPFLILGGQPGAGLTPWGAAAIAIPGFDQLKNVHRAAMLAATLAPVVLALGAEGLAVRLGKWAGPILAVAMVVGLGGLRVSGSRLVGPVSAHVQTVLPIPGVRALPMGAVVSLPLGGPVEAAQAVPVLLTGRGLVNLPPFEVSGSAPTPWSDDNALLNALATLSGDTRTTRPLQAEDLTEDIRTMSAAGVVGVVLHADRMPGPAHAEAARRLLDANLERVPIAGRPTVWAIPLY
jgi:hypothetical protein